MADLMTALFPKTLLGATVSAVGKGLWHTTKFGLGGGARRSMVGAGVGALYGNATSDANSSTGRFRDTMVGALGGLGVGLATTKLARRAAFGTAKMGAGMIRRNTGRAVRGAGRAALTTAEKGLGAAKWSIENPRTAMALAAGGLGALALYRSGPGNVTEGVPELAQRNQTSAGKLSFISSTEGLVQGLHRGRH